MARRLMSDPFPIETSINFGDVAPEVDALLQRGVAAYRHDRPMAERLFRQALAAAPHELPVYFCLYKIHTYQGSLDEALRIAEGGLEEAARQAGLAADWRDWQPHNGSTDGPARFALYTLKALAFIHLRRDERREANAILATPSPASIPRTRSAGP
jgi:hypothetical protein